MAQSQVAPAIGDDVTALMGPPSGGVPPIGADVTALMAPNYRSENLKDPTGAAVVESPGTGVLGFIGQAGRQIDPIALVKMVGSALTAPRETLKGIGAAQGALYDKAKASYQQGDYATAARHFINYLLPMVGPGLDQSSDLLKAGNWAAGSGQAVGLGLALLGPQKLQGIAAARHPLAGRPVPGANPLVSFAEEHGIPLDVGTVTDNLALKGIQTGVDRGTLGGSLVATPALAKQAAAMTQAGETLASRVHTGPVTPEQAGLGLSESLTKKIAGHNTAADTAYERIRALEQDPGNRMMMPGKPVPMDALADTTRGQLRRIVHELDAAPFTPRILQPGKYGSSLEHVEGTGGAGAKVFDDIVQRAGSHATRGTVQNQLETYLGGGPETPLVKAALEVAEERNHARGGYSVTKPELPPSAMDVPTKLEGKVRGEEMGFPVALGPVKQALQPVADQMRRQLPITQQQANPGLKAIMNILEGPDYGSLSQIDRDLGAIKKLARESGGLAKLAVKKLDAAVQQAAEYGGPEVVQSLQEGRQATTAKYVAESVLDRFKAEPVKTVQALTAPKDSAIVQLRRVLEQVPEQRPVLARAFLEDLLTKPQKVADWYKLGPETKRALFPDPGHAKALDHFFTLTDRISKKANINPPGSGYMAWLGGQGVMLFTMPESAIPIQIGAAAVAKLLRSPAAVRAVTEGMSMPITAQPAARAAVAAKLVETARAAGVPLALPKAADQAPSR